MNHLNGKEITLYARSLAPSLGKKEQYIAKFISNNYQQIPNLSIGEMAMTLNVSESSITKVCKKLKCSGFYELKHYIEDYIKEEELQVGNSSLEQEEYQSGDKPKDILEKVFINSVVAIQDTYAGIDPISFEKAVYLLGRSKRLFLAGVGGSSILCQDFQHKLLKIGIIGVLFQDSNMQMMAASLINKTDVIIGISHSGKTKSVLEVLKLAKQQGASVIGITNHVMSPLESLADVTLHSSAQNSPLSGENASARIAQLNILDALYTAMAIKHNSVSFQNLRKTKLSVQSRKE
jgi:DNA-binding MurR/RpiR family transcriptional regulator